VPGHPFQLLIDVRMAHGFDQIARQFRSDIGNFAQLISRRAQRGFRRAKLLEQRGGQPRPETGDEMKGQERPGFRS
jgi:hypothetical protein